MKKRRPPYATHKQLASALRHGQLHKTCGAPQGPSFTILPSGLRCDPAVAREALRRGWLSPVDLGLFDPDTAQSWNLKITEKENVHD